MADRYWVGGTGSWSSTNTANWSTSSGGGSGASVPTAADNVFFDANSNTGTGAFTVTMANSPRVCNDFTASGLDGTMTLAGSGIGLTVSGSLSFPAANLSRTYSGTTTFNATTTGKTVTTNGVSLSGGVDFNGVGGSWTLGSAISVGSSTISITNGTFNTSALGNYAVTASSFNSSNSNVRTINLNASTVTLSANGTPWSMATSTNATLNAGTSTINLSSSGSPTFAGGSFTYYNVAYTSASLISTTITGTNTFFTLQTANKTDPSITPITLSASQTISGTLTIGTGTASAYRTMIRSDVIGTTRTLTCASIAAMSDVDFRDITIAGAHGTLSGTRLGDCKGNSNITFPAAKTVYYGQTGNNTWESSGSGSWSAMSGGALDATMFPLAQDTAVFPAATYPASGSTVTIFAAFNIGTIDMSLRTSNTITFTISTAPTIYGNWINGTGITLSGTSTISFAGRTTQQITSAGRSFSQPIAIDSPSGSVTLQDDFTTGTTRTTTLTNGTLNLQSFTLSTGLFNASGTTTRTIAFGTGNITCAGTGSVFEITTSTNLTLSGTPNVYITSTGSTAITIRTRDIGAVCNFFFTGGTYSLSLFESINRGGYNSLDFTGFAGTVSNAGGGVIRGNLKFSTGMTWAASATAIIFAGTSTTQLITSLNKTFDFPITFDGVGTTFRLEDALTMGSTRTATLTNGTLDLQSFTLSTGLFSSSNSNIRAIAFGTGQISCTGTGIFVWNTPTVTSLTTTGSKVVNITSTGATSITVNTGPLSEANAVDFNFTGGTYALTFLASGSERARNVDFTGFAGTLTAINVCTIYGNLKFSTGMTITPAANTMTFGATSGIQQITANSKVFDFLLNFNGVGGTFQLQGTLTQGAAYSTLLTNGTLNLNGQNLNVGTTFRTAAGTKNLTFNGGSLICGAATAVAFDNLAPTGFTTTAGTGTGTISMTAATAKSFIGGGSTYNCTLNQGGAGALTITGSNTFSNITNTVQPASVLFTAATTNIFSNFSLSGTSGNLITIGSATAANHTLSKSSGVVSVSNCSISRSSATGGATWEALTDNGNVNGGNNTGWIFGGAGGTGNFFLLF